MRLLVVHERFGALAGAEANILLSAGELKQRGHTVGLLHGPGTGRGEVAWLETFADCFPLAEQNRTQDVFEVLAKFQPDVVYVHKMADLEVLEALVSAGVPLVRMVHDHDLYCMRSYKYRYFSREICTRPVSISCLIPCGAFIGRNHDGGFPIRWVSYSSKKKEIQLNQQFNRLIVATNYMKDELVRNGFEPARIEIHPPVPRMGDTSLRSSFSDRNLIIYAGQIIRGKGVDVLLESLALVKTPFECLIFGDGNHRAYCEQLSGKLGLSDRVHFKGFVPQEQLKECYDECSVAVLSSVWPEPFGAVGLEGMRYGLPVVAFDAGGIKEWLIDGFNGFLVPRMDRAKFAERVEQLLRDKPLARQMGERGLQFVTQQFDFAKYIVNLEEMLMRAAAEVRQPVSALTV